MCGWRKILAVTVVEPPVATSLYLPVRHPLPHLLVVLGNNGPELVAPHVAPLIDHLLHSTFYDPGLVPLEGQPVEEQRLLVHLSVVGPHVLCDEAGDWVPLILILLRVVALGDGLHGGRPNEEVAVGSNCDGREHPQHNIKVSKVLKFIPSPVGRDRLKFFSFLRQLNISLAYL